MSKSQQEYAANGPGLAYYFTLRWPHDELRSYGVGEVPGGYRVHLSYANGIVDTNASEAATPAPKGWPSVAGKVATGADWALVRSDGVVTLDGRITFITDDGFIADAVLTGTIDLGRSLPNDELKDSDVYNRWLGGKLGSTCPAALSIRFAATSRPPPPDATPRLKQSASAATKYKKLFRGEFVARGYFELEQARHSPICGARLDVLEVLGRAPAAGAG